VDLGHVRAEIAAAIANAEQAIRLVAEARAKIAEATAQLRVATTTTSHVKPGEALKLWTQAQHQTDEALARLNEGKGHANAYLRSL
jgi:ABC-type transporter Mla subunit MlaD